MGKLKAVIVDDSSFSISILTTMLEKKGFEVIGSAKSITELDHNIENLKPDLVTMDMTLTDGDGIQATKIVMMKSPHSKVLAISAMMDYEIQNKANDAGVRGYIQKPVEENELFYAIDKLFSGEELYKVLTEKYYGTFKDSIISYLKKLQSNPTVENEEMIDIKFTSKKSAGVSVSIGIIGKHYGRLLLDISDSTLRELTKIALSKQEITNEEMVAFFSEFGNIIAGNSCSLLNNINRCFSLRVSPPTVFHGKDLTISISDLKSSSLKISTDFGDVFMNVGFQRGDDEWM